MPGIDEAIRLMEQNEPEAARAILAQLIADDPQDAAAVHFSGMAAAQMKDWSSAESDLNEALRLQPDNPLFHGNTGVAWIEAGRFAEALNAFREASRLEPENPTWWNGLGFGHLSLGHVTQAEAGFRRAFEINPADDMVLANLVRSQCFQGRADDALDVILPVLNSRPRSFVLRQAAIWPALYSDRLSREQMELITSPMAQCVARDRSTVLYRNNRNPDRRLRIGFVSPDFRNHAVLRFIAPLVEHIDQDEAEITLYSTVTTHDEGTEWLVEHVKSLRPIPGMSSEEFERLVLSDKIDILVDLAGHSHGSRILDIARRLAPVQLNWLGFPASTSVPAIDARLVDAITDPEDADRFSSERLVRMPHGFHCFRPEFAPALDRETQQITFGSFNNAAKISESTVRMWVACLNEVPNSQLLLKSANFDDPGTRDLTMSRFTFWGIAEDRVRLLGHLAKPEDHLAAYNRLDVALDTYPYHGTTTTCEALWMGVPVVTLLGDQHHSRVSASLLNQVGHPEWVAATEEEYVEKVVSLAGPRTKEARAQLRHDMLNSPLMNEPDFAERWMASVRSEWRRWASS